MTVVVPEALAVVVLSQHLVPVWLQTKGSNLRRDGGCRCRSARHRVGRLDVRVIRSDGLVRSLAKSLGDLLKIQKWTRVLLRSIAYNALAVQLQLGRRRRGAAADLASAPDVGVLANRGDASLLIAVTASHPGDVDATRCGIAVSNASGKG